MTACAWWAALLLAALALAAGCSGDGGADTPETLPTPSPPATEELRRAHGEPVAERIEFTLEALSANYQRKQGAAGAGLAHHFLNLICSATDPALHEGRCPTVPTRTGGGRGASRWTRSTSRRWTSAGPARWTTA